ncbi:serine hydrolase [Saccharicrinis sp. FJH54]|uniref:serine hydrolase n=1 Tax=Saccharicrinis sp. FJH54 TaxID=3344665 RepID=UPI0035D45706
MKKFTVSLILVLVSSVFYGQSGIPVPAMSNCDNQVNAFLNKYDIPGATLAITYQGRLIYMRGFGYQNLGRNIAVEPYNMFRIASVSKGITSIAIMKLIEEGNFNIDDKVFGDAGILADHPAFKDLSITDARIYDITVKQLLEHTAGWNRDNNCFPNPTSPYPYYFSGCDPISAPLHVTQTLGVDNPATEENMIQFLLLKGLDFDPGTEYHYSNIGYLVLGEIIETITGMSYEDYVKTEILDPLGIYDMHLGKNLQKDKFEREVDYFGNGYTNLSIYGTGEYLPWEYGGFNIEAMDAHGGWIASARDLVRLLVSVDKFSTKPDILNSETLDVMVDPSTVNSNYAKGWQVNQYNNWWHTGALDGTASLWARTSGGFTWAFIMNKRITDARSNAFWSEVDNIPWSCITGVSDFPEFDLMLFPKVNTTGLSATDIQDGQVTANWTRGDGDFCMLVCREGSKPVDYPFDGVTYFSNSEFLAGDDLGNRTYVLYTGTGNSATITGLDPDKSYYFRVFEYNKNSNTGDYPLYLLAKSDTYATTGNTTGIDPVQQDVLLVYHDQVHKLLHVTLADNKANLKIKSIKIYNLQGQAESVEQQSGEHVSIATDKLVQGIYFIVLNTESGQYRKKFTVL